MIKPKIHTYRIIIVIFQHVMKAALDTYACLLSAERTEDQYHSVLLL